MLNVDLHCHTRASRDARTRPRELVERAAELGLDRVAVTDHGEIEGALEAKSLDPGRVIVGEEIRCRCRTEIIGLFLEERIPTGRSLAETVERIRDQGGVIYLPHPYAYVWRPSRHARRGLSWADAVEVVNARAFLPFWNRKAGRAARRHELPACAGSDAHFPEELGRAFTRMPAFRDAASFRAALAATRPVQVATTGPGAHVASVACKVARLATEALPSLEIPGAPVPQREGSTRG
jgi:predicted metal-dependent phosphoesterase TrpH